MPSLTASPPHPLHLPTSACGRRFATAATATSTHPSSEARALRLRSSLPQHHTTSSAARDRVAQRAPSRYQTLLTRHPQQPPCSKKNPARNPPEQTPQTRHPRAVTVQTQRHPEAIQPTRGDRAQTQHSRPAAATDADRQRCQHALVGYRLNACWTACESGR